MVLEKWWELVFCQIINVNEFKYLDEFLFNKINDFCFQKMFIESLFIEVIEKFRSNIKMMYFVLNGKIYVGYKDLMENYQIVVSNLVMECGEKDINLVFNFFQLLLDEFICGYIKNDFELVKSKVQKKKWKQECVVQEYNGYVFVSYQVSILQLCEQCFFYIWFMDKVLFCSVCKMICYKKCVYKIQSYCFYIYGRKGELGVELGYFGVCVDSLISDKVLVFIVLEKFLEYVEMYGLYIEGFY